jgi:hypothetical protein
MGITEQLVAAPDSKIQELIDDPGKILNFLEELYLTDSSYDFSKHISAYDAGEDDYVPDEDDEIEYDKPTFYETSVDKPYNREKHLKPKISVNETLLRGKSALPLELFEKIFSYISDSKTLFNASRVNSEWNRFSHRMAENAFFNLWAPSQYFMFHLKKRFSQNKSNWLKELHDQAKRDKELKSQTNINLDKAWNYIHWLLSGDTDGSTDTLLGFLLGSAGKDIGEELYYGPAKVVTSTQLKQIDQELQNVNIFMTMDKLNAPTVPFLLGHIDRVQPQDHEYIVYHLRALKAFIKMTVQERPNHGLVYYLT